MGLHADYGTILHLLRQRFDASLVAPVRPAAIAAPGPGARGGMASRPRADLRGPARGHAAAAEPRGPRPGGPGADPVRVHGDAGAAGAAEGFPVLGAKGFGPGRTFFLNHEPELNLAHCCGTLRFGDDPATSVLDAACRAHEVDNLHVADGSFMPTSNGINPSLTIAANALRVADSVAAALGLGAARRAEPRDRNQPLHG